ncbi:HAMP domain-containing histidine kinase [Desulfovibrio mangrovi]|uniref:HAMP domain-containing sensor histidine kinase n=1 Tax=Desulfovibrio mangrovi TaxID=2976983 RepID=UPI00224602BB|nr:HAMP domain-containing sensor histidine kinase [Desulfovibrio mangrovi]UZP67998.1 HAMP domain-containing histidine kinase [Desulfovibrio mangrovi]
MRINSLYTKILLSFFTALAVVLVFIIVLFIVFVEDKFDEHVENELLAAFRLTSMSINLIASDDSLSDADAHADLQRFIDDLDVAFTGMVWLEKPDGSLFISSRPQPVPKFTLGETKTKDKLLYAHVDDVPGVNFYFAYPVRFFGYNGTLGMLCRDDIYNKDAAPVFLMIVEVVGVITLLLAFPVVRRITVPLRKLEEGALRCASGDLSYRVDIKRGDEVGRVARAFNVMADSVEKMLRMKQELMANVSHEMRSPLARMRVALELAELRMGEGRNDEARRHLLAISDEVEDLDSAIGGVIELSRFDAGAGQKVFSRCDLAEMMRGMLQRYVPAIEMKQLELECDLPEQMELECQKEALNAVIKNLLENAVKFTEQSGFIRLELFEGWGDVVFSVANSYRRLSEKELGIIFQPFSRAVGEDVQGTGLGLALVERIVTEHGGKVVAQNIRDGVRFVVRLPRERCKHEGSCCTG